MCGRLERINSTDCCGDQPCLCTHNTHTTTGLQSHNNAINQPINQWINQNTCATDLHLNFIHSKYNNTVQNTDRGTTAEMEAHAPSIFPKSRLILDVFALPNFRGARPPEKLYSNCCAWLTSTSRGKVSWSYSPIPKVIGAHMLNFGPFFKFSL